MIPCLYENNETEFLTNGIGHLPDAISCTVTEERNGKYELEMSYPVSGKRYTDLKNGRYIYVVPFDGGKKQAFEIYKITKPINGKITVKARHMTYKLSMIPTKAAGNFYSAPTALQSLRLNAIVDCPFDFWTDVETVAQYETPQPASIRSRLGGTEGSILDAYGGEYEWDMDVVKLHKERGSDNGVYLRYGKNITDFKQEENIEDTVVGIFPYWRKEENEEVTIVQPDEPVFADNADEFPYQKTAVLDCSSDYEEEPTIDQLKAKAEAYIKANDIGKPKVSITVSFIALWQTEEYKEVAPLERVRLCDTVHVVFDSLGVSTTAKVTKTVYNVLQDRYNSITIGEATSNLSNTVAVTSSKISKSEKDTRSFFKKAIDYATTLIKGGVGGHVVLGTNADGEPNEILIMDTDDKKTAVNVLRINMNGIGFSSNGYNGPFESAWTLDGKFNADFIATGTLDAELLRTGTIMDRSGLNSWDLETGELTLQSYMSADKTNEAIGTALKSAEEYVDDAVTQYDGTLEQTVIFNKLTNNGATQGIYLKDGKLYINADYMDSGTVKGISLLSLDENNTGLQISGSAITAIKENEATSTQIYVDENGKIWFNGDIGRVGGYNGTMDVVSDITTKTIYYFDGLPTYLTALTDVSASLTSTGGSITPSYSTQTVVTGVTYNWSTGAVTNVQTTTLRYVDGISYTFPTYSVNLTKSTGQTISTGLLTSGSIVSNLITRRLLSVDGFVELGA